MKTAELTHLEAHFQRKIRREGEEKKNCMLMHNIVAKEKLLKPV